MSLLCSWRDVPCLMNSTEHRVVREDVSELHVVNLPRSQLTTQLVQDFPADMKFRKTDRSGRERSRAAAIQLEETTIMCIFSHSCDQ